MASTDGSRANTPAAGADVDDDSFPQYPHTNGPPSIISSRMTDIGTEDGRERETQRDSLGPSQTGTTRSAIASQRAQWPQPTLLRRGLSGKRASLAGSIGANSTSTGRPVSAASRSHVPSVSSSAFFHPMSSQKLQAHRGATRPSTMSRHVELADNGAEVIGANVMRHSITSNTPSGNVVTDELPPSRGTQLSGPETCDRRTFDENARDSVTDSVRPLHNQPAQDQNNQNLSVRVDPPYEERSGQPSPFTPNSLRSSFMLRANAGSHASNRNREGAEKLGSVDSSPGYLGDNSHNRPVKASSPKPVRKVGKNWEYFTGNTVFCLGGRFQNTRSRPVNIATGAFIIIPCILFFIFSAKDLWYDISPAVPIIFAYLTFVCVSSFFHASLTDPGILPRNLHQNPPPDIDEDPLRLAPPSTDWTLIKSAESSTAAMEVPTKYCKTCQIWRPPRTHHCRMCDNCIETADHHCVWLNNCVGRRNYRYFFTFVSSATLLALYLVGASLAQILVYMRRERVSFAQAINHDAVPFAMVLYGFIGFLYPAALMGYHMFLMARGETTREFLNSHKFLKKDRFRTFTQGAWYKNWMVVLCRPRPPTYYHFKKSYNAGDQRLATMRLKERQRRARQERGEQGVELHDIPARGFEGPAALRNASQQQQHQQQQQQ